MMNRYVRRIANVFGNVLIDPLNWTLIGGLRTAAGGKHRLTTWPIQERCGTVMHQADHGTRGA